MRSLLLFLALIPIPAIAGTLGDKDQILPCSDVMFQIQSGASYVGSSNYVVQLSREKTARLILFLQQPSTDNESLRWRLIERQGESLNYCVSGQGNKLELLGDMHLSNPTGKYGMPGSGLSRCAGKQESGLPGSIDIRMWANKELGNSLIYSLPNHIGNRDFIAIVSADNAGAWIILDSGHNNLDDTCYYDRGEASKIVENFVSK